jgi:phthiocerol/phenolphthiocerol synthesis type-I polyketide synthase E
MNRESIKRDIAIIGISCKFSKSENPNEFWENLKEGNQMIQFYSDEELAKLGVDKSTIDNPAYIKRKSTIQNSDSFDYPFFSYTKDEANLMDPQIRILHQQVWSAIEDAGYNASAYKDKIGMYMTAEDNFNWIAHSFISENKNVDPFYLSFINNKNFISSLISYNLNLKGPSIAVDTACSSSLMTIHLASKSLLLRECSLAVAGGINLNTKVTKGHFYHEGGIGSKDGYCRTFDSESSGTTGAEGSGVVVLKRLEEAIRDRDNIYAVIRSSAVNNDGRKIGYTAPSVKGQAECIKMAHRMANVPYNTISYIEAHGTGTKLGDPIEIEALNQAFNYDTTHQCAVGSLKSNIGHSGNAAGVGGLIKATLSLKNKMIPGVSNYKTPNPEINFKGGPFFVNAQLTKWESKNNLPLRAGVSSFGIGGTNVHMILEEFEKTEKQSASRPFQLITYSAKNENSLINYKEKLKNFVENQPFQLADLAYTLKTGRAEFAYKSVIVAKDKEELGSKLQDSNLAIDVQKEKKDLVFMFSGQGTQYFKMGKDLYDHEPEFKKIIDEGFQILHKNTGQDFAQILGYRSNETIDENRINETQYTQPLLFLIEYALASVLLKWGIKPHNMIGHSLGEYTAACIAEVFSFEDALKLIAKRAQLMSGVEKGSMVAIDASIDTIAGLLNTNLSIAAINSPTSCVVSGTKNDIENFIQILTLQDISCSQLKTSHAFHSGMMDVILDKYEQELDTIQFSNPKLQYISNLTGKQILDTEATSSKYWVRHLRETVNFRDGIDFVLQKPNVVFIEIGPGKTLLSLSRQNQKYANTHVAIELLRRFNESTDDNEKFTTAIGKIWSNGIKIDWNEYYATEERNRISAPTYSFDGYKLDFLVDPFQKIASGLSDYKPFDQWFYMPNWKKAVLAKSKDQDTKSKQFLIFSDDNNVSNLLESQLTTQGNSVIKVIKSDDFERVNGELFQLNPGKEHNFTAFFKELERNNTPIDQIIFNWNFEGEDQEAMLSVFNTFNALCKSLINYNPDFKKKITLLSGLNHEILGDEKSNIALIASMKQLYVCSQENPNLFSCSIDINQEINDPEIIAKVIEDLQYNYTDTTIAFRNGNRWTQFYDNVNLEVKEENKYLKTDKTYLITGGLGKVGKILSTHLSDTYNAKIILTGRSSIPPEDLWDNVLSDSGTNAKVVAAIKALKELKKTNKQVYYYTGDVSDYSTFSKVVEKIEADHGQISGVIHAAGNIENSTFKSVENLSQEIAVKQFLPKVQGTLNINAIFEHRSLDFVWITSSLASVLGGLNYGVYAVSNGFIDAFVNSGRRELKNWFYVNLDGLSEERIDDKKLVEVFERTFSLQDSAQLIVSARDPNSFKLKHGIDSVEDQTIDNERTVDRNVLSVSYQEPETETEQNLCEMIQLFFGYQKVGVLDDFFEMGADSLKAMTLLKRINKTFSVEMNIQDFYSNPNIKKLAAEIELAIEIVSLQDNRKGANTLVI